jgi:hypothetical protein
MPAIHKVYREACQKFPGLCPEDIAQQAALCFLETARSPEMQILNGHLPAALSRRFRQSLFRWAMGELRQSLALQEGTADPQEPATFEQAITLDRILQQAIHDGLLSDAECELLLKLKYEGFQAKELAEALGTDRLNSRRLHRKLQTILNRLQRAARAGGALSRTPDRSNPPTKTEKDKKIFNEAVNFSESVCIRNSEKGNSPERSRPGPQLEPEVPPVAA